MIKKSNILLFILLCLLFSIKIIGQNETNNWYFGNKAGLSFHNGTTTVLTNGAMNTPAGCSAISDVNGELLFYTNGESVWNKNHVLMTNGTGLAAEIYNTQTSIIIPKPNDPNTFYIFTTRINPTTSAPLLTPGLYYSEIQFSSQNPLGAVTIKNVRLIPSTTERLTAIHHSESNTIRVIAFGRVSGTPNSLKDTFFVFNVNETGVLRPPTISSQEATTSDAGAMKISPNGKYVAVTDYIGGYIYIYDFNNNNITFNLNTIVNTRLSFGTYSPYGLEFSQDSKNLYYTVKTPSGSNYLGKYFIESLDSFNEPIIIANSSHYKFGSLQLARNGNIYMASYDELDPLTPLNQIGVITYPESTGAESGFQPLAIRLNSGQSYKGLPNFIQSYFRNRIITKNVCVNVPFDFSLDAYAPIQSVNWEFGDGCTSTLLNPNHQYTIGGEYTVKATITINNSQVDLYKKVEAYALPSIDANQRLMQCDLDNDGISFFNLNTIDEKINNPDPENQLSFYKTLNDAQSDFDSIENPEVYENQTNPQELFVKIISPEGCETISNFFIETTFTELDGIANMYTCEDSDDIPDNGEGEFNLRTKQNEIRAQFGIANTSTLSFYANFQNAQTRINPLFQYHTATASTIWVRVDNPDSGCNGIGTIRLFVNPELPLNIEETYTICDPSLQSLISLDGNIANDRWEWRDGSGNIISTNRIFNLTEPGSFSVTVYKDQSGMECSREEEFTVLGITAPTFEDVIAGDYEIFVAIDGESQYEFSLDDTYYFGQGTSYTFSNVQPGIYNVYVRDINDCEPPIFTEVSFIGFPKYFTPNGDGFKDIWKIDGISPNFYSSVSIEIYDRYGKRLHTMNLQDNDLGWNGTLNGKVLNSTDYWFTATLVDLENNVTTENGHFSLIF